MLIGDIAAVSVFDVQLKTFARASLVNFFWIGAIKELGTTSCTPCFPTPNQTIRSCANTFARAAVDECERVEFLLSRYMQGSAMERIIQQQGHTWRAVGERSGRLCATNLWQRLADARVEQLKATYAGIPSGTTKIPVSFDGRVTDIKHYNFAQDIEVPQLAGSATISSLFSVLAVENLRATRQVMMQLGDMAALIHLRIIPHYRVLGVGNIINTGVNGDVTLYRPPLSLRSALREGTSLKDRRVMVMQNKAMRKLSVWSGDPIPAPRVAPSRDVDTVFITRSFSLLNF